mmetsp:Transcript_4624/g.7175  ORF Transcript_4624/g.7175 Transcript_4624/m.7175 type:complete len:644 (+) Transcript_4624:32-1963(+)
MKDSKKDEEKRLHKLLETPEEKRARRLDKKFKKEQKRLAKQKEEDEEKQKNDYFGYNPESNPFGDANLREQFTWKKKKEKEAKLGLDSARLSQEREKIRREELKREIEKARRRREEREVEKQRWEEERARLARERESLSYADWEKKEDEFHLDQAIRRSEIRIKEGRAKPIDIIAKNLHLDNEFDIDMNEPYKIFKGLSHKEMIELQEDIQGHLELDTEHREFWQSMIVVCEDELEILKRTEEIVASGGKSASGRGASGLHSSIEQDVVAIFRGKSVEQLNQLHTQITDQINSGVGDVEYWESLLKRLTVHRAKATLREIHASLLTRRLRQLQEQQAKETADRTLAQVKAAKDAAEDEDARLDAESEEDDMKEPLSGSDGDAEGREPSSKKPRRTTKDSSASEAEDEPARTAPSAVDPVPIPELLSPPLVTDYEPDEEIVDPEEDLNELERHRQEVYDREAKRMAPWQVDAPKANSSAPTNDRSYKTEEEMYKAEASKLMEEGDAAFNDVVTLDNQTYWWHDKYRPRRPRFFNRVHTGYEWNKYNQTHYDHDNPPPKIVQGYKFNIFYPDLIDKIKPPQYFIEPSDSPDTVILRIHAGPPYEDVAFKIVNREWEYSHKKGFKCTFERGIFHLYFNFRRYRYRR